MENSKTEYRRLNSGAYCKYISHYKQNMKCFTLFSISYYKQNMKCFTLFSVSILLVCFIDPKIHIDLTSGPGECSSSIGAIRLWDPPSLTGASAQLAPQRGADQQRGSAPVAPLLQTSIAFPGKYQPRSTVILGKDHPRSTVKAVTLHSLLMLQLRLLMRLNSNIRLRSRISRENGAKPNNEQIARISLKARKAEVSLGDGSPFNLNNR